MDKTYVSEFGFDVSTFDVSTFDLWLSPFTFN